MRTVLVLILGLFLAGAWSMFVGGADSPADAEAKAALDAEYDARWAAIEACRAAALRRATYPSKASFHAKVDALSDDSVNWTIVGKVDLMNDFGTAIPHRYACTVRGETVESIGITAG